MPVCASPITGTIQDTHTIGNRVTIESSSCAKRFAGTILSSDIALFYYSTCTIVNTPLFQRMILCMWCRSCLSRAYTSMAIALLPSVSKQPCGKLNPEECKGGGGRKRMSPANTTVNLKASSWRRTTSSTISITMLLLLVILVGLLEVLVVLLLVACVSRSIGGGVDHGSIPPNLP